MAPDEPGSACNDDLRVLRRDPESGPLRQQLLDYRPMTLRFGCDRAQETFEEIAARSTASAG